MSVQGAKATIPVELLSSRVVVVSDFNCPYCFTLNEWLQDLDLGAQVFWVGVEHKPHLPLGFDAVNQPDDLATLSSEVSDVQRRAPEVGVSKPPVWINSRIALLLQAAVEADAPERAAALRTAIFRRFWRANRNIASSAELDACLEEAGLQSIPVSFLDAEQLDAITAWWSVELDRIPCMLAPSGLRHLGLQDRAAVHAFIRGALHASTAGPSCR